MMKHPSILLLLSSHFLMAGDFLGVLDLATEEAGEEASSFFSNLFAGTQRIDSEYESFYNEEIWIATTRQSYEQERNGITLSLGGNYSEYFIDYTDPVGATLPSERTEESLGGNISLAYQATQSLSLSLGGRYYQGFADFQSVWISEYYDQFIGGSPLAASSYRAADPSGWGIDLGLIWDYRVGARLTFGFNYGRDQIVPAWSFIPNPDNFFIPEAVPTIDELESFGGSVAWEQALNPRLKTQLLFRASGVTARQVRYQLQNNWAWAVTPDLTLRGQVGGALENPSYEALFGGLSLNYEFIDSWHLALAARLYHDTGEFTSAGFNTAAPELDSSEVSLSLAWSTPVTTVRLSVGFFDTNYGGLSDDNQFFADLYEDRHFVVSRLAISHQF